MYQLIGIVKKLLSLLKYGVGAICLSWIFGACLDSLPSIAHSDQITGSWVKRDDGCEQLLILGDNGRFTFSTVISIEESSHTEIVSGEYLLQQNDLSPSGSILQFFPDNSPKSESLIYCDQWQNRSEIALPLGEIETIVASDPSTFRIRSEVSQTLGKMIIATDDNRQEQIAIYKGGENELYLLGLQKLFPDSTMLYQSHFSDSNRNIRLINGILVINLPNNSFSQSYAASGINFILGHFYLNLTSAVEIKFSGAGAGDVPVCSVSVYSDLIFQNIIANYSFPFGNDQQIVQLNPSEANPLIIRHQFKNESGDTVSSNLVSIGIFSLTGSDCTISISARPLVVRKLEELAADGSLEDYGFFLPGPSPRLIETGQSGQGRIDFFPFPGGLVNEALYLSSNRIVSYPLAVAKDEGGLPFDHLSLIDNIGSEVDAELQTDREGVFLNIFSRNIENYGIGPFVPFQRPDGDVTLSIPADQSATFALAEDEHSYVFSLEVETLMGLWSDGGLRTMGKLFDAQGRNWGRNTGGASDGNGFYILRTLPAGEYDLMVSPLGASGDYTLRASSFESFTFPDDGLKECLIDSGWYSGATFSEVFCGYRNISSLEGLESHLEIEKLVLSGNLLTDITPLQSLVSLRELSLDGNQITDISPLSGLDLLERISLVDLPLEPSSLSVLISMRNTLTYLDLTGINTISESDLYQLKSSLPNTFMITPDGTVLE